MHAADKKKDTFITLGYMNWKDAAGVVFQPMNVQR